MTDEPEQLSRGSSLLEVVLATALLAGDRDGLGRAGGGGMRAGRADAEHPPARVVVGLRVHAAGFSSAKGLPHHQQCGGSESQQQGLRFPVHRHVAMSVVSAFILSLLRSPALVPR
jgi:hypothetical protein